MASSTSDTATPPDGRQSLGLAVEFADGAVLHVPDELTVGQYIDLRHHLEAYVRRMADPDDLTPETALIDALAVVWPGSHAQLGSLPLDGPDDGVSLTLLANLLRERFDATEPTAGSR